MHSWIKQKEMGIIVTTLWLTAMLGNGDREKIVCAFLTNKENVDGPLLKLLNCIVLLASCGSKSPI